MQIALENNCGLKVKVVELLDEATQKNSKPLTPIISDVLGDQPLVQCEASVLSSEVLDLNVKVENKKLKYEQDCTVVIGSKLFSRDSVSSVV